MHYYHYVTLATVPLAEKALEIIKRKIDSEAYLPDEIAPYENQECETDIYLTTSDKLTDSQMEIINGLNAAKMDLDNPDD